MSSLEIAELTGKRHHNVVRDIKAMVVALYGVSGASFEATVKDDANLRHLMNSITCEKDRRGYYSLIRLDKAHTLTLIAGYDAVLRKRIVDRWMTLEEQAAKPRDVMVALNDPVVLRGLLSDYAGRVLALHHPRPVIGQRLYQLQITAAGDELPARGAGRENPVG